MTSTSVYKEDVSISYISALCADAHIDYDIIRHDADSVDGCLKKVVIVDRDGTQYYSSLTVQLKCTELSSQQCSIEDGYIKYKLKLKNYNELRGNRVEPIILALLVIPQGVKEFVVCNERDLLIHGRMYWLSLYGRPKSKNKDSVTIKIPLNNIVNQRSLITLLKKAARGHYDRSIK